METNVNEEAASAWLTAPHVVGDGYQAAVAGQAVMPPGSAESQTGLDQSWG